jgi:dTDP-glucose 4,6-dehydratase
MQYFAALSPVSRFGIPFLADALSWAGAVIIAVILRFDFRFERIAWGPLWIVIAGLAVLQLLVGLALSLYRGRYRYGTFDEAVILFLAVALIGMAGSIVLVFAVPDWGVPRSAIAIATPIALVAMIGLRTVKRMLVATYLRPTGADLQKAVIYGAGELGTSLAARILSDPASPYIPVAYVDDSPVKQNLSIRGVRVLGVGERLGDIVRRTGAKVVIVAIGRVDAAHLRRIDDDVRGTGAVVRVLPPFDQLIHDGGRVGDVRDVNIEDLIGRAPVEIDVESIADYIAGARVLVTGAGGSIGSELVLQLSKFGPADLILLDRDESGLQSAQITIRGHGLLDTSDVALVDIRDSSALQEVFRRARPDVVFHAAALKHLPLLEQFPDEAWKTNVVGTLNVLEAAREVGVKTFVNISTDKAASPTSALGHSKRLAEKLTAWAAAETGLRYVSVRFGNVIGSRGSMLPTFQTLIESGGPVTVTHREVERYFMTIPEASQLVIQAGAIGQPGEVLILDMGEPVRILDIAERMIAMSGKDIAIVFTGLRPGEKLREELIDEQESAERSVHPQIMHAQVTAVAPESLDRDGWLAQLGPKPPRARIGDSLSPVEVGARTPES